MGSRRCTALFLYPGAAMHLCAVGSTDQITLYAACQYCISNTAPSYPSPLHTAMYLVTTLHHTLNAQPTIANTARLDWTPEPASLDAKQQQTGRPQVSTPLLITVFVARVQSQSE